MRIAIMQPYIFPYIGYFQMVDAVETFVFYDDVHFIKKGWINKNRILLNGEDYTFTIPCVKISQNKLIAETEVASEGAEWSKLLKQIETSYRKAPHFKSVFPLIEKVLTPPCGSIADLAIRSVEDICSYLQMERKFVRSSVVSPHTKGIEKADRLIQITLEQGYTNYVNAPGGRAIYTPDYFAEKGVALYFIQPHSSIEYPQINSKNFVPWLSIIDVIMNCSVEETRALLTRYNLDQ